MERIATGGGGAAPLADAGAARAAIAAAGALPELDSALRRAAAVLVERFAATHAAVLVQPRDDRAHAVAIDAAGLDSEHLRRWLARSGKLYRGLVAFESAAITGDITSLEHAALSRDPAAPTIGTIMHLPLRDEHGETIGIVATISDRREAFGESQLEEFRELVRILSGLVRRSLLLEQVVRERALLAHEAALMTEIAQAGSEVDVARAVAGTLKEAIGADLAVVVAWPMAIGGALGSIASPAEAFATDDWESLHRAVEQQGNRPLLEPLSDGCYVNFDLAESAPTPVEQWIASHLGHRAFVLATGPRLAQTHLALGATRREPDPWSPVELAFAARLAGLLEMGMERHRSARLAALQSEQIDAQSRLLLALDPVRPLNEIAASFAKQLEAAFGVECLAVVRWSDGAADGIAALAGSEPVLYRSPLLAELPADSPLPPPSSFEAVRLERPEYMDLEARERNRDEELLFRCGIRYMARIPISTAGHVSGFVSVRFEHPRDPEHGFEELENAIRPLALVIEHSELLARLEQQRRTLATTADILRTMAASHESAGAGDAIALALRQFFEADAVVLGAIEAEGDAIIPLGTSHAADVQPGATGVLLASASESQGAAAGGSAAHAAEAAGFRSAISASFPLATAGSGLAMVASRRPDCYGQRAAAQLTDLCGAVGLAIDRLRLIAGTEATTRILGAQTHVLAALGPGATIEGVGEVFVAEARKLFGATHALVATLAGGGSIVAMSSEHLAANEVVFERRPNAADLAPYADLLGGKAQLIEDLGAIDRGAIEQLTFAAGVRTLMRVPIRNSSDAVSGLITLGHPEPGAWSERDLASLVELSSALGLVSERAALLTDAEQRASKVSALTRLLSTFNASAPPEEVARLFAAEVRRFLAADVVLVYAFDHDAATRVRVAFDADASIRERIAGERDSLAEAASYRGVLQTPRAWFDSRQPEDAPAWLRNTAHTLGLSNVIAVRLDADGSPVGMIAAGTCAAGRLGSGELHILNEVAAPLAMLLERARVVTSLQQQTQRTRAVLDILAALGPRESFQEVASAVANALRTMYAADHCIIATLDEGRIHLAAIESDIVSDWMPGTSIAAQPTAAAAAVAPTAGSTATRPPQLLESGFQVTTDFQAEASSGASRLAAALRSGGLRSSMRVRVGPVEAPLGIVTVGSRQPGRYTDADARELAQIVQPLGVAVSYFRDRRESEQRTLRLEYTNRILARLSSGGTVEHLAAGFLAECCTLFQCGHAVAMLVDPEAGAARVLAVASDLPDASGSVKAGLLPATAFLRLTETAAPGVMADVRLYEPLVAEHAALADAGLHSAIVAPLIVHDTVHGAVALWAYGTGVYTQEDADLLATLTRPLAIALEKADAVTSLGESELKYRSLVAQAEEMIFLFDSQTLAILDANAYTARTLGYSGAELRQMCLVDLVAASAEEVREAVQQTLDSGEFHVGDRAYIHQDGARIEVDEVASVVSYGGRRAILVLARDVSERKAIQRQLVQAQKMESLGSMAGAVAHDFNNLLTTILGFAGLLKRSTNFDTEERENLGLIEDAARRAADLTGRLLAFARGGLVRVGPVDLRSVVADTMRLSEPGLHAGIRATTHIPGAPVIVEGDGGQLQLALLNIVLNAKDAMPDGGTIDIALLADEMTATITIADNGPGMDDETRMRIFEPFYTTKPLGSGTGLGMAITYGIIQGHHGTVELQTAMGGGTRFTITLPLLPGADELVPGNAYNAGEGNLVLVVDDDELVRRTTSATLAQLGYNVVEAPGGSTAVEIVRARPDRFSAVLLDLVMPGMTGSETFRALTEIRPDLPVVVCTGYAADSHIDQDVKRRIAGLVQKPFTSERLSRAMLAAGAVPSREAGARETKD